MPTDVNRGNGVCCAIYRSGHDVPYADGRQQILKQSYAALVPSAKSTMGALQKSGRHRADTLHLWFTAAATLALHENHGLIRRVMKKTNCVGAETPSVPMV